ncbi:MAG: poly-beta-1,6-N-acetyl-D-glucosamine biosynthesis protein PgaD [Gammaproteobacteria bacterium]|nr:poly-beta-1,6-N-acetyl-D-glucosamine biosynthesis protein PgaD [Gammaproteobacteria bacterium]
MKSLIINRPDLMTMKQKYANNILKLIFVLVWLYFLIPVFTFIAWYLAFVFFEQHLLLLEGYKEYKTMTSVWYLIIIASFSLMFMLWSIGNLYFSKKKLKNLSDSGLSIKDSCEYYKVPVSQVMHHRKNKNITVHFDDNGLIKDICQ